MMMMMMIVCHFISLLLLLLPLFIAVTEQCYRWCVSCLLVVFVSYFMYFLQAAPLFFLSFKNDYTTNTQTQQAMSLLQQHYTLIPLSSLFVF